MPVERIHIEQFITLAAEHPVIDVRSPGEYNHAHLPEAHSMPLFTDEERKIVGTSYKQRSREVAIKDGVDFFGPKMRAMIEQTENIIAVHSEKSKESKIILIYCWRGGMRSGAVSWLLDLYGFKVYTLIGGYKKFRNHVLDIFKIPLRFHVLGGYTGSGKTELLLALKKHNEAVIDLEGIASHKGSAFGNIGLPTQPSQEMFENILALSLQNAMKANKPIWLEDESQRIGHINIPKDLWTTMRNSPVFFLDIPFEERLKYIVQEYGKLDKEQLIAAIERIKQKLGGQNAQPAIEYLQTDNFLESFRILLKYYDKFYQRSLHNRENINSLLHCIECKSITTENTRPLLAHAQKTYSPI
ncbi:MAG: tRNA 2-selenouridine(34) synthase MnmH [Bacteroidetes bacterium]|nr:tRNA 2-selenouridine(34) synthase MnmH [Bacteroidota bacterium]